MRACVGLRRRLRVVVVHAPCVPTTTTYSLRIYRCPYYVFTDARTTTTTYLPMYVLHTYRFYLLLLCTDVPTTTHRAGRMPECSPLGRPTNKCSVLANTQYLLTEPGACPRRNPSDSSSRRGPLRACPGLEVGVKGWVLGVGG